MISIKEKVKIGIFDKKRIAYFVLEKVNKRKAVLLTTNGGGTKRQKKDNFALIQKFIKSKWKGKEIVPLDNVQYQKAKKFMIII